MRQPSPKSLPVFLFLASVFVAYPVHMRGLVLLDEGTLLNIAERLTRGEVLYRDVATGIMPGVYYFFALLFQVFSPSVELGRYVQLALLGVNSVLVYLLALRFARYRVALATAALFLAMEIFPYRYPNYSPLAVFLVLLAVLFFLDFLEQEKNIFLLLSGGSLALSFLTKQNYGLLVFVSLVGVLLLDVVGRWIPLAAPRSANPGRALRQTLLLCLAFAVPVLLTLVYLIQVDAFGAFYQYCVAALVTETLPNFYKPYPLLDWRDPFPYTKDFFNYTPFPPLINFFRVHHRTLFSSLVLVVYLPLLLLLLGGTVRLGKRLWRRTAERSELVLVVTALALFAGVFPRSDFHHLSLVLPLPLVLGAHLYERLQRRWNRPQVWAPACGLVAALALASAIPPFMATFFDMPEREATRLGIKRAERIRLSQREAARVRGVVSFIRSHVEAGQPLLVIPNDPMFYFLSERSNPSPYPLVLPGSFEEEPLLEVLPKTEYIVYRDTAYNRSAVATLFPRLGRYLRENYVVDRGFLATMEEPSARPFLVLRKQPPPARTGPAPETSSAAAASFGQGSPLLPRLAQADVRILSKDGVTIRPRREEVPRIQTTSWLLTPALGLRPPSGWQKLVVSFGLSLPETAQLQLAVALRPVELRARSDGAVLEIYVYDDSQSGRGLVKLETVELRPWERDSWRWRPLTLDLGELGGREVILAFAASAGPGLDETGDEILLGEPRIVPDVRGTRPLVRPQPSLPRDYLATVGRFDDAESFRNGLAQGPDPARTYLHLGQVLADLRQDTEARQALTRAATLDGSDFEVHLALAEFYLSRGENKLAAQAYQEVLKLDEKHVRALSKLAELALASGEDAAHAYRLAKKASRYAPEDPNVRLTLARGAAAVKRWEEASRALVAALELAPGNGDGLNLVNHLLPHEQLLVGREVLSRASEPLAQGAFTAHIAPRFPVPEKARRGQVLVVPVEVGNLSGEVWPALGRRDGSLRVALGHRWIDPKEDRTLEEQRTLLPADVPPGGHVFLDLQVRVPESPGAYLLKIDMLQEGVTWFGDVGTPPIRLPVHVE